MIPPGLAIALGKILGVVALMAVLAGLGEWHGRAAIHQQWDAAIMEQQVRTGEFIVKQAYNSVRADKMHQDQLQQLQQQARSLSKKVRDYDIGTSPKSELSPEFESVADRISRVREPDADGLPAAGDAAGIAHGPDPPRLTDVAILSAYQAAVTQLYACAEQANTLMEWVRSSHAIAAEGAGR